MIALRTKAARLARGIRNLFPRKTPAEIKIDGATHSFSLTPNPALRNALSQRMDVRGFSREIMWVRPEITKNGKTKKGPSMVRTQFLGYRGLIESGAIRGEFELFRALRKIPTIREHIPPTVRYGQEGTMDFLLVSDLTQNGKYLIYPTRRLGDLHNHMQMYHEQQRLKAQLRENGYRATSDAFFVQADPATMMGVKVWLVDLEGVRKEIK